MHYRLYFLNAEGGFADVRDLECGDDADALARARAAQSLHGAELWQGSRKVVRIERHPPAPGAIDPLLAIAGERARETEASARRGGPTPPNIDLLEQRLAAARDQVGELEAQVQREIGGGDRSPGLRSRLAQARESLRRIIAERDASLAALLGKRRVTPQESKARQASDAAETRKDAGDERGL